MYQPTQLKKTTTPSVQNSIKRSSLRYGFLFILLAGLAGTVNALPPPVCPGPDCRKVMTFYNNTTHPVFVVIQAGIQNPDPWLQAVFNDNTRSYAETHYSRAYINPVNGIPPGGHVSVTVPWYSELMNDIDHYCDWYNGGRVFVFDTKRALDAAHNADKNSPLSTTPNSPVVSCDTCEQPLTIYKDTAAYGDIPFQLLEYTFADVGTVGSRPIILDLNVGYNISYLDQIYLPIALEPCRTEPCNSPDPAAVGYLGTTQNLEDFRSTLTTFSDTEGWPRYNSRLDNARSPRLPGAYNVLVDRVNVIEKHQPSQFTPVGVSVTNLINQWKTCTSGADRFKCPQYQLYQELNNYFKENYNAYRAATNTQCPPSPNYPQPPQLTPLNIMPYVYGWAWFNSGCQPVTFNDLKASPGPLAKFTQVQFDYIHKLQYNYLTVQEPKQRFNPFVNLVHGKLGANGYAFSVDDAVSYQNHPGEGLIITIGGPNGLPNPQPVVPPPNYTVDFVVSLGDSIALHRPRWKSFGVCKDVADTDFPPLPPNATVDAPQIIVDSVARKISEANPCKITVTDASNRTYQFEVRMPVPWPSHNPPGFDPQVLRCVNRGDGWCGNIGELAVPAPNPQFVLFTQPPPAPR